MDEELTLPWDEEESEGGRERPERVLTVAEVNRLARSALEGIEVLVQGEVSGVSKRYQYYVYCSLRDDDAVLPAIIPTRVFDALGFKLADGMSVVVRGKLTLYEQQGKYQVRVAEMRPFGEGEIQRRIEALKRKLQDEGLFADERKRPLPRYPQRIGVVTSPRGAAVRDIAVTIARRFPPARVYVRGVQVQGADAARQISEGLKFFDAAWPVDVVILARGGGSIEDLEPFSSEVVARAVAGMSVPVITGIGHEPDVSVADLVADRRASTPTAAAEAAVPDRAEVRALLAKTRADLSRRLSGRIQAAGAMLGSSRGRPVFLSAEALLSSWMQRFERQAIALPQSPARGLARGRSRLQNVASRPVFRLTEHLLGGRRQKADAARARLAATGIRSVERARSAQETLKAKLEALSPLAVLERGYSITFDARSGAVISSSDEVETGAVIRVKLGKGALHARVEGKE